jgi:AcrR family transcriptional regulator
VRLTAEARRAAILESACTVFSQGSYRGTTTAHIALAAGVTEPILYRHFGSKRDLYLSCISEGWRLLRDLWDTALADEPDPGAWPAAMARAYFEARDPRLHVANLWVQALTEASGDAEIRKFLRRHMREVHRYVAGVIRRSQAAGGILPDRDASAEAWIFISIGLLKTVGERLGGLLEVELPAIAAARREWMTGRRP